MRRKSSRNASNVSPEKAKPPESQRKSRRQSSRRRKRSSSRSSEDSEEVQPDIKGSVQIAAQNNETPTDVKSDSEAKINDVSVEPSTNENKAQIETDTDGQSAKETCHVEENTLSKDDSKDPQERNEDVEDVEEKKNKGKSKGKNNSNIEQSSNNLEPETENENVQGTHQSPSNDSADNENVVQNVNDPPKIDSESQDDGKIEDTIVTQKEDQQQEVLETNFVSEYAQIGESSQSGEKNVEPSVADDQTEGNIEQTDPASKTSEVNISDNVSDVKEVKENEKSKQTESSKKKITLRRSPPGNKDAEKVQFLESSAPKVERSSSTEESKKNEETKQSKKIVLKRHTTDDSSASDARTDIKPDSISRSLSEDVVERKRRLSSVGEDKEQSKEDKPKKVLKQIKLIRTLSRENADDEEKTKRTALRRQRWARSDWLNKLTSSFYKVDVESIKIVCPTLEFLGEHEVNLETAPRERKRSESDYKRKVSIDNESEDSYRPDYEKQVSEESSGEPKVEPNPNIIAMNRKISIVDDTASKLRPPPSPAKNPASDVLFITNLVRPFTVKQLKELLERTGTIKEEGFWTDRIKSKCYVQYETTEEAEATRNALHGVHWPIGNGKKLVIDYATAEDLEKAKNPAPVPVALPEKLPEKENREPEKGDAKGKDREREERRKREAPVREWDLGKEDSHRRFSRSRSRERVRKHSRRSYTPEDYVGNKRQRKNDDAVPQKLMDDLFLKTKATPSIYWQPLSPEEIVTKQQQRLVRMEEHKRRIEENRGRGRDGRRMPFRRR